jgi:molybdenum cofactor synthesis domain-containing protein
VSALASAGFTVDGAVVIPDGAESVADGLRRAIAAGARLVVTTGGTGVGPRDLTPEGTASVITRELPGVAEQLRRAGADETPMAIVSRAVAGVVDPAPGSSGALIVNLPGSPRAVASGMPIVLSVARHVIDQLGGGDHA